MPQFFKKRPPPFACNDIAVAHGLRSGDKKTDVHLDIASMKIIAAHCPVQSRIPNFVFIVISCRCSLLPSHLQIFKSRPN
jgi:hypothetical protein